MPLPPLDAQPGAAAGPGASGQKETKETRLAGAPLALSFPLLLARNTHTRPRGASAILPPREINTS